LNDFGFGAGARGAAGNWGALATCGGAAARGGGACGRGGGAERDAGAPDGGAGALESTGTDDDCVAFGAISEPTAPCSASFKRVISAKRSLRRSRKH
jgi:hypothetical protein